MADQEESVIVLKDGDDTYDSVDDENSKTDKDADLPDWQRQLKKYRFHLFFGIALFFLAIIVTLIAPAQDIITPPYFRINLIIQLNGIKQINDFIETNGIRE